MSSPKQEADGEGDKSSQYPHLQHAGVGNTDATPAIRPIHN